MAELAPPHPVIAAMCGYLCPVLFVCGVVCLVTGLGGIAMFWLTMVMDLIMLVPTAPPPLPLILTPLSFLVASLTCVIWRHILLAEQRDAE